MTKSQLIHGTTDVQQTSIPGAIVDIPHNDNERIQTVEWFTQIPEIGQKCTLIHPTKRRCTHGRFDACKLICPNSPLPMSQYQCAHVAGSVCPGYKISVPLCTLQDQWGVIGYVSVPELVRTKANSSIRLIGAASNSLNSHCIHGALLLPVSHNGEYVQARCPEATL